MTQPPRNPRRKPLPPVPQAILTEAQRAGLMPLDYLLSIMRDPNVSEVRRDRAATCAAQYCHPRAADTRRTKKSHQAEAAKRAGAGTQWAGDLDDGSWSQ